ncbi:MAG: biotin--[acetyl-CoA-carboxylase] ligase [Armatimonadetes bacterium]|nr:biotin--[acetyl-CoA-carboxylase] ligase [Armatimonadota bacterium]
MIPIHIYRFNTVTSTNDVAIEMAQGGKPEGTVVLAKSQTAGRGRRGRVWLDEPGSSVLMSAILRPEFPPDRFPELSLTASLSVAKLLESAFALIPTLKWPNDVLVRNRKIAGILVETTPIRTGNAAIVGIGLNVNITRFPPELDGWATSIAAETGSCQDVDRVSNTLAKTLFAEYEIHLALGFEEILVRWRKYMCGLGKQARVETGGSIVEGTVSDVDSSGALILIDSSGQEQRLRTADAVRLVDEPI